MKSDANGNRAHCKAGLESVWRLIFPRALSTSPHVSLTCAQPTALWEVLGKRAQIPSCG